MSVETMVSIVLGVVSAVATVVSTVLACCTLRKKGKVADTGEKAGK